MAQTNVALWVGNAVFFVRSQETMKSADLTTNAPQRGSSCHADKGGASSWLDGRRGLLLLAVAVIAGLALALNQHWLFVAQIAPLLFLLPCMLMMFMCMKGHSRQSNAGAAPETVETGAAAAPQN